MQRKIDDQTRLETLAQAAPTEAPTLAGAAVSRRTWRARGAAVGVIALALGLAGCGGGSDSPAPVGEEPAPPPPVETPAPPAEVPPPVETPPAPPPAVDPTPAGFTKTGEVLSAAAADVGDVYKDSTNTRTVAFDAVNNRYYELVTPPAPVTWADADVAAATAGGALASPSDAAKMLFIKQAYPSPALPLGLAGQGGDATGSNGAWIGLKQTGGALPADGWTFLDTVTIAGTSPLWNAGEPNDAATPTTPEVGNENFGAIFAGRTAPEADLGMIYDAGIGATATQTKYLIQYLTKEAVKP